MSLSQDLEDLEEMRMGTASYDAAERMVRQGLRVVPRPLGDDIPQLPRNVTDMPDENLMELFTKVTSWVDYLSVQHAAAEIDERATKRTLDAHGALAMLGDDEESTPKRKESVSAAKARRDAHPKTVELTKQYDDAHAYTKLVGVLMANLDRDAALLSRELSRRIGMAPKSSRAGRML